MTPEERDAVFDLLRAGQTLASVVRDDRRGAVAESFWAQAADRVALLLGVDRARIEPIEDGGDQDDDQRPPWVR